SIATPTAGSTYAWALTGGGNINLLANSNQITIDWTTVTVGVPYLLTVTESALAGCTGNPVSLNITVNASTVPAILVNTVDNPACDGATVNFTSLPTNEGATPSYQWKKNGTNITGETNPTYSTNVLVDGDIISCMLTSAATCSIPAFDEDAVTMVITPVAVPAISIMADNNPTCLGGTVIFTSTSLNEGSTPIYQWQLNGTDVGIDNPTFSSNTLTEGDEITCVLTSNQFCASPVTVPSGIITISIKAGLAISIAPQDTLCAGYSQLLDPGSGYVSYLWNIGLSDQSITANEVGLYSVIVTDQFGCMGFDTAYLKLCPKEFLVPNAFTPNSDGINDVFRVIWNFDEVPTSFRMLIYNQWGTLVFTGTDIFKGWDGTTPDGNPCPFGVYTYYLTVEKPGGKSPAQQNSARGMVTLVR
ncbi:MAG: gliding motility-associated C-terminal domain-containing protein, partial [Bacteroidales bacterium]